MQVEINLFKAPTVSKVFQNFLSGRQGGVDWCPRNATLWHEMSMVKIWSEVSMWVCVGSTLSNEMRLNPRKLQWNCDCCPSMVLHSLSRTTCVSIVKSGVKFRILFLDGFSYCRSSRSKCDSIAQKSQWYCDFVCAPATL
jgi:hypothetical protein